MQVHVILVVNIHFLKLFLDVLQAAPNIFVASVFLRLRLGLVLDHEGYSLLELLLQVKQLDLVHLDFVVESVNSIDACPSLDQLKDPHELVLHPLVHHMNNCIVVLEQEAVIKLLAIIYEIAISLLQILQFVKLITQIIIETFKRSI